MQKLRVEFPKESASVIDTLGRITGRTPDEVIGDALRVLLWAVHEQTCGRSIVSQGTDPDYRQSMVDLVKDRPEAVNYFRGIGWDVS